MKKKPYISHDIFCLLVEQQLGLKVEKEYRFHPKRKWRFDYAIVDKKIAIEVEGGVWVSGRHISPQGFIKDMEKYNTATSMGWRVLRFLPADLMKRETLFLISETTIY